MILAAKERKEIKKQSGGGPLPVVPPSRDDPGNK
jgi:hypothetical protein